MQLLLCRSRCAAGGGDEIRAARPFFAIIRGLGRHATLSAGFILFAPARKAMAGFNEKTGGTLVSSAPFCIAICSVPGPEFPGSLHAICGKCLPG